MSAIWLLKEFIQSNPTEFIGDVEETYNAIEELERLAEIGKAIERAINETRKRPSMIYKEEKRNGK